MLKTAGSAELIWAVKTVLKGMIFVSPEVTRSLVVHNQDRRRHPTDGLKRLTPREQEVLKFLVDGLPCKEIARRLFISPKTVHTHKERLMTKLKLRSQADLVRYSISRKIEWPQNAADIQSE